MLLSTTGYLSPLLIVFKPEPVAVPATASAVKPSPKEAAPSVSSPASPPKWRYSKPDGFDAAGAGRITIIAQRILGEVAPQLPVALAPDGRSFAYCRGQPQLLIQVADLETLDVIASVQAPPQPGTFAWSPDSGKLLIATEGANRGIFVLDVGSSRLMSLPQLHNTGVPDGRMHWWYIHEVLFTSGDASASVLNLETLQFAAADTSPKWNGLSESERNELRRGRAVQLAENARWRMSVDAAVRRYDVPSKASENWPLQESLQFAFVDVKRAYRSLLPPADVSIDDALVAASDGTKLVRLRQGIATVYFFGVRSEPAGRFKISIPASFPPSLDVALTRKEVAAFVCPPLINPLNGRTVGPNRNLVKAIARVASWRNKEAEFWIDEDYIPIQAGDVVSDLHTWEENKPRFTGDFGRSEWFAVIGDLDSGTPPPLQNQTPALDRGLLVSVDNRSGANRVERVVPAPRKSQSPANQQIPPASPNSDLGKTLFAFVLQHHAKSSRGDVNGLVSDYADHVDHFTNGVVDRAFIRKDETEYHSPGTQVTEEVIGKPVFGELEHNLYSATYSITYHRIRPDGRWTKGISDIEIQIELTPGGLRIIRQRAQTHDQQKSP